MTDCIICDSPTATVEVLPEYDAQVIGMSVTIRNAALRHHCAACGFEGIEIPDSEDLEKAVALARLLDPAILTGPDIRFLRKACGMTAKRFAEALDCKPETLSRWENCTADQGSQGTVSDRIIRNTVWGLVFRDAPAIDIEPGLFQMMTIRPGPAAPIIMERVRFKDAATRQKSDEWDIAA